MNRLIRFIVKNEDQQPSLVHPTKAGRVYSMINYIFGARMKQLLFLTLVISSFLTFAKNTDSYALLTAGNLLKTCENYGTASTLPIASRKQGTCEGYVFGVIESMPHHCIPESTQKLTIIETIRAYIKRHENEQGGPASKLVVSAVAESWQCAK